MDPLLCLRVMAGFSFSVLLDVYNVVIVYRLDCHRIGLNSSRIVQHVAVYMYRKTLYEGLGFIP